MRERGSRLRLVLAAGVAIVPVYACQLIFPTVVEDAAAPFDARVDARRGVDAALEGEAAIEAATGPYNDFQDKANWESYNFTLKSYTFGGGTFDGRYVYFTPWGGSAARYDTHAPFTSGTSWEGFDTTTISEAGLNGALSYFIGAVFDGKFVYFVPQNNGEPFDFVVARFDVSAKRFDDKTAWATFDTTLAFGGSVQAFSGATFDGRYVYFVPAYNGTALQYDTTAPFGTQGSWVPFDMTKVNGQASGLLGALFDGRYVYFVPYQNMTSLYDGGGISGTQDGVVMRYDTKAPFATPTSWTFFNTAKLEGPNTQGFAAGVFDGRYVYLSPFDSLTGVVTRVDVDADFLDATAWSTFTTNEVSPKADGYWGGGFDGRYVYMAPYESNTTTLDGLAVRYDTTATFSDVDSWSSYDMQAQFGVAAVGFGGAIFDGEYLYYVPAFYTTIVRFHARSSPALPNLPDFYGSFY